MITIKMCKYIHYHNQIRMSQISVLKNPLGVGMPLTKVNQTNYKKFRAKLNMYK